MNYPGNAALAPEIRQRIATTFAQTIDLAEQGRLQEAALGCDFILKMDPQFEPARVLHGRLDGASGTVAARDLALGAATAAPPVQPSPPQPPKPPATPPRAAAPADDLRTVQFSSEEIQGLALTASDDDVASLFDAEEPALGGAAASSAEEPNERIRALLDEGQQAFDRGEFQNAINAWSRIFLIDVDHALANRKIDDARKHKAEQERASDELLHEGVQALEAGQADEARAIFERVLAANPSHLAAQDYLAQLDSGTPILRGADELKGLEGEVDAPMPASFVVPEDEPAPAAGAMAVPPAPPPAPTTEPERRRGRGAAPSVKGQARVARADRSFVWIGAGFLVLLLVGGWFLFANWRKLFPNVVEAPVAAPASAVQEAKRLYLTGDVEGAMERLRRVPPVSPERAEAKKLLAEWSKSQTGTPDTGQAEAEQAQRLEQRAAYLERGRRAYEEKEYLKAAKSFRLAERIEPLDGPVVDLYADTKQRLAPIAQQIDLFQQRDWERILPTLWRRHLDDEENRDVLHLLVDSYFNLGVRALRSGDLKAAAESFQQAAELEPHDSLVQRLLLFSTSFRGSTADLLYEILVSQLEYRT